MQNQRFLLIILIFAISACSVPDDADTAHEVATSVEQNEEVVRQVLALIDERNLDAAFELYALDYIYHGPGGEELRAPIRMSSWALNRPTQRLRSALPRSFALPTVNSSKRGTDTTVSA